jgi:hypothetical protein
MGLPGSGGVLAVPLVVAGRIRYAERARPGVEAKAQMSQGTLDLRWIVRQIWPAVGAVAVWGLLAGIAVAALHPVPLHNSPQVL